MTDKEFREKVMTGRHRMYAIALQLGLDADEAADAVQDTLIRLWKHRADIPRDAAEVRVYAFVSIRNECLTRIRLRKTTESIESVGVNAIEDYDRVEQTDSCKRIECLVDLLPKGQKEVIRLSAFAQLDNHEIAAALDLSEANVRQLLSRGRKKLKEMMQHNNK